MKFAYSDDADKTIHVKTLEEREYPQHYYKTIVEDIEETQENPADKQPDLDAHEETKKAPLQLREGHFVFQENQKGVSFDSLLGPYLKGAAKITVTDPYIRLFYQMRNFMEFLETGRCKHKASDEEVTVHLVTSEDEFKGEQQKDNFEKMKESASSVGVNFTWEFDKSGSIHARHIVTDHGWKISLDRGLDIFQHYE